MWLGVAPAVVYAHQVGSPEFYWAIASELSLVLWTALLLLSRRPDGAVARRRFWLIGLGAALLAALITLAGKTLEVWPGHPLFPSGHTAYAVAIAVILVRDDRRRLWWAAPLVCLLGVALVLANYHIVADVLGGAAVGAVVGLAAYACMRRWPARGLGAFAS